jgi:hypothetical protein
MSSQAIRRKLSGTVSTVLWLSLLGTGYSQASPPECAQCQSQTAGDADISVDQNGTVDKECARLSRNAKHKAKWTSKIGKPLIVEFQLKAGQKPPFLDMGCRGSTCSINACDANGVCKSGEINPEVTYGCYHYAPKHKLAKGGAADPEVMIDP